MRVQLDHAPELPPVTRGPDWHLFQRRVARRQREVREARFRTATTALIDVGVPAQSIEYLFNDFLLVEASRDLIRRVLELAVVLEAHADFDIRLHPTPLATTTPRPRKEKEQEKETKPDPPRPPSTEIPPLVKQYLTIIRYYGWSAIGKLGQIPGFEERIRLLPNDVPAEKQDHILHTIKDYLTKEPVRPKIERVLRDMLCDTGAWSCGLFVLDPWNPPEYRPYILLGYRYPEAMYGYCGESGRKALVVNDEPELFFADAVDATVNIHARQPRSPIPHEYLTSGDLRDALAKHMPLFGNLPTREGIQSCARFLVTRDDGSGFILWINFARRVQFDKDPELTVDDPELTQFKDRLRVCRDEIAAISANGQIEAELTPVFPSPALLRLHRVCDELERDAQTLTDPQRLSNEALGEFLTRYLKAIVAELRLPNEDDLGSTPLCECGSANISLLNTGQGTLEIVASAGKYKPPVGVAQSLRIPPTGVPTVGIASWVAVRGHPVVVNDIKSSRFNSIYFMLDDAINHEITLPLVVGDEVIGVLNFESDTRRFPKEWISPLNDIASKLARIWSEFNRRQHEAELARQNQTLIRGLLSGMISSTARVAIDNARLRGESHVPEVVLNLTKQLFGKWAELTCQALRADRCVVWCEDPFRFRVAPNESVLVRLGKHISRDHNYQNLPPDRQKLVEVMEDAQPRPNGWTHYVMKFQQPVCLTATSDGSYRPLFWRERDGHGSWHLNPVDASAGFPQKPHPRVEFQKATYEVAIPLLRTGKCFGVAWVKYIDPPDDDVLRGILDHWPLHSTATVLLHFADTQGAPQLLAPTAKQMELLTRMGQFPGKLDQLLTGLRNSVTDSEKSAMKSNAATGDRFNEPTPGKRQSALIPVWPIVDQLHQTIGSFAHELSPNLRDRLKNSLEENLKFWESPVRFLTQVWTHDNQNAS